MKSFFLIMVAIVCATTIYAQDTMITQSADVLTVYDVEISSTFVFYKTSNSSDAKIQKIEKSQVLMIKRPDGTKYNLGNSPAANVQNNTPSSTPGINQSSNESQRKNAESISKINTSHATNTKSQSNKSADWVFAGFGVTQNSVLINDDLEVSIKFGSINSYQDFTAIVNDCRRLGIQFTVKNKTSKTIYIDCANTFLLRGEKAEGYYVNAAAAKVITYNQRVIAVAPFSVKELKGKFLNFEDFNIEGLRINSSEETHVRLQKFIKASNFKVGEQFNWSEDGSPVNYSFMLAYSFSENCTQLNKLLTKIYLKELLGITKPAGCNVNDASGVFWYVD